MTAERPIRQIKSFVLRQGRMTSGQEEAMEKLWPRYGLAFSPQRLDPLSVFGRRAPLTLEIGFGNGDSLAEMAAEAPERDFIGVEVHTPGVGHLLKLAEGKSLQNLRVIRHDALDVLEQMIEPQSLDCVQLFFPDPWHKTRHHKRRIVQPAFLDLVASRLRSGGTFHMATDWENYAHHALLALQNACQFHNTSLEGAFCPRPKQRPLTKFEQRGQRLGHGVWDLVWKRR